MTNRSVQQFALLSILLLVSTSNAFAPSSVLSTQRLPQPQPQQHEKQFLTFPQQQPSSTASSSSSSSTRLFSVEGDFDPDAISRNVAASRAGSLSAKLRALYKFTRPHTIRGTILASIAGTTRALLDTPGAIASADWYGMLPRAFIGMVALLLGNAFIVGINQIYDQDIDKLNKPFLPVASGEMNTKSAWLTVLASGIVGPILV